MAKKDKIQDLDKEERGGGKILTVLIIFLIVLIWLTILALLIKFDVGGLGSEVLRPVLKDVPYINRILPDVSEDRFHLFRRWLWDDVDDPGRRNQTGGAYH